MKEKFCIILVFVAAVYHFRCEAAGLPAMDDTTGVRPWEVLMHELAENDEMESDGWEDMYDRLCQLEECPININTATREELGRLPFLSDSQIEDICEYIYRYGGMKTIQELVAINSIDYIRRGLMQSFVYAGEPQKENVRETLGKLLKNGHNELTGYVKVPLYSRKGDINGYHGYKYKHWIRYGYVSGSRLKFGLVASQDAGEPLFGNKNRLGYDYYSPYFLLRDMGNIESLAIGRYRLSFGMGLVVNSGFSMGKASMLSGLGRYSNNITAHSSRMESGYFQGAGVTVRIGRRLKVSAFASYRDFDATLNKDERQTAATLITSGYHRTDLELQKKNNTSAMACGMNARYYRNGFNLGATTLYTRLSRELVPDRRQEYRRYYAGGRNFINTSIDYGYASGVFAIKGEMAFNKSGAMATVNSISADIANNLNIMLLQRYYSRRYSSLYSRSFSEGGHVQNESGIYLGAGYSPCRSLRITAYSDYAYFPWARYRVSRPSWASDNMVQCAWGIGKYGITARYRMRVRARDIKKDVSMRYYETHSVRIGASYSVDRLYLRTSADFISSDYKGNDTGYMLSQTACCGVGRLKFDISVAYFDTDSYESRLYAYEKGPLYSFTSFMCYGNGMRGVLIARADVTDMITGMAKIGYTSYFDRSSIGSGLQTVNSSSMTDIELQLRMKF